MIPSQVKVIRRMPTGLLAGCLRGRMYILGAGVATPDVEVSDEVLVSLGEELDAHDRHLLNRFGVSSRRVSFPREYINKISLDDPRALRAEAQATPTSLGNAAIRRAVEAAGISLDQVGLIVTDCGTPQQTCPSEAHRITGSLGLKIPSFDVIAGLGAFCLHIEMLRSWRDDRLPDYFVIVSSNTPSYYLNYSGSSLPAYLFGDASAAFVLSTRVPGKLRIRESSIKKQASPRSIITVDRSIVFNTGQLTPEKELLQMVAQTVGRALDKHGLRMDALRIAGPQLFGGDLQRFARDIGTTPDKMEVPSTSLGFSLGAAMGIAVAQASAKLSKGEAVLAVHGADGLCSGTVLITAE